MADTYIPELGATVDLTATQVAPQAADDTPAVSADGRELWLKIGQSNSVGTDGSGPIDHAGEDSADRRVWELSRGIDRAGSYLAAPAGEIMLHGVPAQDDSAGIGFGLHFGKQRVALNPRLERVVLVNRGVGGTGFAGNRWNPGDDLYNAAVADCLLALQADPSMRFGGFIWHQGESDAGQGQAFYEAALSAMVAGMRAAIPGADGAPFLAGTMVESWIAADETNRRPIDVAHRRIADYIPNSAVVDFDDLTDLQDTIHFGTGSLRIMGRRYADAAQSLTAGVTPSYVGHRIKVVDGEVVDLAGNGGELYGAVGIVNDPTRGDVLDSANIGWQTSMLLNPDAYTKSMWINVQAAPASFGNICSGSTLNSVADSHYWGWGGYGHGGTPANNTGISGVAGVGTWVHVALTWDGTQFQFYANGVANGGPSTVNTDALPHPQIVQIGRFAAGGNQIDALFDDVVILPYAASAAEVADLAL